MSANDISAWIMAGIGCILLLWQSRRRFKRLNQFGVEQFSSFHQKIGAKMLDGALYAAGLMLVGGGVILLFVRNAHSLPLIAFLVIGGVIALFERSRNRRNK